MYSDRDTGDEGDLSRELRQAKPPTHASCRDETMSRRIQSQDNTHYVFAGAWTSCPPRVDYVVNLLMTLFLGWSGVPRLVARRVSLGIQIMVIAWGALVLSAAIGYGFPLLLTWGFMWLLETIQANAGVMIDGYGRQINTTLPVTDPPYPHPMDRGPMVKL
jgi:hypothetical protein